jgi:hypothetical protein
MTDLMSDDTMRADGADILDAIGRPAGAAILRSMLPTPAELLEGHDDRIAMLETTIESLEGEIEDRKERHGEELDKIKTELTESKAESKAEIARLRAVLKKIDALVVKGIAPVPA